MTDKEKSPLLSLLERHYPSLGVEENRELIFALEEKLETSSLRTKLNSSITFQHDFSAYPPIFACAEPTDYLDGLSRLTERLSLFVSLVAHNKEYLAYVWQQICDAMEIGRSADFRPFYQDLVDASNMEYMVSINRRLDINRCETNIAALRKTLGDVTAQITAFDKSDWPRQYAECDSKLAKLVEARECFLRTGDLPEGFVISPVFQGFAEDQFTFDEGCIRTERQLVEAEFRRLCEHREDIISKLTDLELELSKITAVSEDHLDDVKQVVSITGEMR